MAAFQSCQKTSQNIVACMRAWMHVLKTPGDTQKSNCLNLEKGVSKLHWDITLFLQTGREQTNCRAIGWHLPRPATAKLQTSQFCCANGMPGFNPLTPSFPVACRLCSMLGAQCRIWDSFKSDQQGVVWYSFSNQPRIFCWGGDDFNTQMGFGDGGRLLAALCAGFGFEIANNHMGPYNWTFGMDIQFNRCTSPHWLHREYHPFCCTNRGRFEPWFWLDHRVAQANFTTPTGQKRTLLFKGWKSCECGSLSGAGAAQVGSNQTDKYAITVTSLDDPGSKMEQSKKAKTSQRFRCSFHITAEHNEPIWILHRGRSWICSYMSASLLVQKNKRLCVEFRPCFTPTCNLWLPTCLACNGGASAVIHTTLIWASRYKSCSQILAINGWDVHFRWEGWRTQFGSWFPSQSCFPGFLPTNPFWWTSMFRFIWGWLMQCLLPLCVLQPGTGNFIGVTCRLWTSHCGCFCGNWLALPLEHAGTRSSIFSWNFVAGLPSKRWAVRNLEWEPVDRRSLGRHAAFVDWQNCFLSLDMARTTSKISLPFVSADLGLWFCMFSSRLCPQAIARKKTSCRDLLPANGRMLERLGSQIGGYGLCPTRKQMGFNQAFDCQPSWKFQLKAGGQAQCTWAAPHLIGVVAAVAAFLCVVQLFCSRCVAPRCLQPVAAMQLPCCSYRVATTMRQLVCYRHCVASVAVLRPRCCS